jgi:hypothetical protein
MVGMAGVKPIAQLVMISTQLINIPVFIFELQFEGLPWGRAHQHDGP